MSARRCKRCVEYGNGAASIVASCKECGGPAQLEERVCLAAIAEGVKESYGVESVRLRDYREIEYDGKAFGLVSEYSKLISLLERLAHQEAKGAGCARCAHRPVHVWGDLLAAFLAGFEEFQRCVDSKFADLGTFVAKGDCAPCRDKVLDDLRYVLARSRELASGIMFAAYRMVI